PLHLEPEAATLILAASYADQVATIRSIAFSLPFPFKLYVKEHPTAMGLRTDGFYKELQKVPNVVLISPSQSVPRLVQKSQGVITLSSTMGFEALLLGKPVYVLGNVFYTYHPLCQKAQGFDDLKKRLEGDQKKKPKVDDLESVNLRFMASYLRNTLKGGTMTASQPNDKNDYRVFYDTVKQRIRNVH
ncbi:MAG: hypothetical protein Q8P03_01055, partial [bacterium]|nr:hypothetical protein [bacterium]